MQAKASNPGRRLARRGLRLAAGALLAPLFLGCVTVAEYRKLEYEVNKLKATGVSGTGSGGEGVADLRAEMDGLREEVAQLRGQVEETDHRAQRALDEAQAARREAAQGPGSGAPPGDAVAVEGTDGGTESGTSAAELKAYRVGYDAWRKDENQACIDRFGEFLQTYPSSKFADDASYWLADCYFKMGDLKTAILRFDDVASRYPKSEKAPEALYREGEALLKLGPNFGRAAEKAFDRVVKEYPDSRRAKEATQQLAALRAG